MADLYPLDRKAFLSRMGQALRDTRLGAQLLAFLDHSGERTQVSLVVGGAAGAFTVTGIDTEDRIISVHELVSAGAHVDLTSEFTITAADTIDNTGGSASTGNQLMVVWGDRAP
jgi:hypothetical protein